MPKLAGDHVQVLVDGHELTGDSNRVSINESRDLFDITAFGDEAHKFSPGQRMMALQHAGFMNSADGGSHPVLGGAAVDGLFSLYLGENAEPTVGDPVFSLLTRQGQYGTLPQVNRMIPFQAGFANRGEDGGWGIALTQPVSVVGPTSGTAVDNGAASYGGGLACLHVLNPTDGDLYAFSIQGSFSGAFAGEESTLATFTLDGRALGSELVKIGGAVPRYVRWKAARSGSAGDAVKIAISLIRTHEPEVLPPQGLLTDFQFEAGDPNGLLLHARQSYTGHSWLNLTRKDGSKTDIQVSAMIWGTEPGSNSRPNIYGSGGHEWTLLPSLLSNSSFYIYLSSDSQIFEFPITTNTGVGGWYIGFDSTPRPTSIVAGSSIRVLVADSGQATRIKNWIAVGSQPKTIKTPAKPEPPSLVAGDEQVTATISPPTPGGAPISTYRLVYREVGSTDYGTVISNINTLTYTVTGLTNGTAYKFKVAAVNQGGLGTDSDYATATPSS